ncbi:hypothetical protein ACLI08_06340 [Flavobacterium sp. RNTU_13]|uniref:hypothetical protein n=1 Tax=Flavobacterium sp. RNTU_13 TaxID=3375145 RepID=UPI00398767C3
MNVLPNQQQHIVGILIFGPIIFKGNAPQNTSVQDTITDKPLFPRLNTMEKSADNIQMKENRQIP